MEAIRTAKDSRSYGQARHSARRLTHHGTLSRMNRRERLTISLDQRVAARVRQCGARTRGGASGYLERLVQADALREAANSMARWYAANPTSVEDSLAETAAALGEAG